MPPPGWYAADPGCGASSSCYSRPHDRRQAHDDSTQDPGTNDTQRTGARGRLGAARSDTGQMDAAALGPSRGARRGRPPGPPEGPAHESWCARARQRPGPGRDHPCPGGRSAAGPAAAPPWPDGRLRLRVLSRCAGGHGLRSVDDPAQRHHRPGQRRRPPVQLRPVRLARANARVRRERLRRDDPRPMGMGRQAPCRERRDRQPNQRLQPLGGTRGRDGDRPRLPRADGRLRRDAPARHLVRPDDRRRYRG